MWVWWVCLWAGRHGVGCVRTAAACSALTVVCFSEHDTNVSTLGHDPINHSLRVGASFLVSISSILSTAPSSSCLSFGATCICHHAFEIIRNRHSTPLQKCFVVRRVPVYVCFSSRDEDGDDGSDKIESHAWRIQLFPADIHSPGTSRQPPGTSRQASSSDPRWLVSRFSNAPIF